MIDDDMELRWYPAYSIVPAFKMCYRGKLGRV